MNQKIYFGGATVVNGVDERKLLPAMVVCCCLVAAALIVLGIGCGAVRHLPGGGTQPATRFEQILVWNAAAAQANDGFADNVIGLQRAGFLGIPAAKNILVEQAKIAEADRRLTNRISAAALCATQQAGPNATIPQLDTAGAACVEISASGIAADLDLVLGSISDLNTTGLLEVKDPAKRLTLSNLLADLKAFIDKIYSSLESGGVIPQKKTATLAWAPEVIQWR